jgi:chemotaxis protein methyltransferase WspC
VATVDFENLLKQAMGLDAVSVGSTTIDRAVRLRMASLGLERREDYWQQLHDSTAELQELVETVVVAETSFFRDREAFAALVRLVIAEWLPAHPTGILRLLSVPCSTGEEPYSMIMALLDGGFSLGQFQVDAVDISARALAQAQRGIYGMNSFRGENLSFRERYFRSTGNGYVLVEWVSEKVNFRQGNLLSSGFRIGQELYDVIFCRNLLIYFDRSTQERAMTTLGTLLAPGGFLFVGPAEAFLASCSGFRSVNHAMSFAFRRIATERIELAIDAFPRPTKTLKRPASPRTQRAVNADRLRTFVPSASVPAASVPQSTDLAIARRLADAGRLREAAEGCERHLQQQGPSSEAYYLLGLLRGAAGNTQGAAECYRRVLYLEPEHLEALTHLALLTETHGDTAAAERFRERARRVKRNVKQGIL